jgi:hypothetical protein
MPAPPEESDPAMVRTFFVSICLLLKKTKNPHEMRVLKNHQEFSLRRHYPDQVHGLKASIRLLSAGTIQHPFIYYL